MDLGLTGCFVHVKCGRGPIIDAWQQGNRGACKAAKGYADDETGERGSLPAGRLQVPEIPAHSKKIVRATAGFVSSDDAFGFVHLSLSTKG